MMEAGKVLQDRYRVEKQIGQGGMGAVYVATDLRFESTVAIKETLFTDEKFRKAFEREARLLNSLRHPALPRVSDHFIEGNGQFLVMEYIAGEDLSGHLEHEGRVFPITDVLDWADQLLDALEYLHGQEMPVIHRDIKPQNLKLTARGQIILLDFGLAKGNPTNPESATAAKSVFGYSRNYASLEQIQGTGTDPRSDLYSLAATLYHLLTGIPPADALTRAMNVLSDKQDPLVPVDKIRPEIPAAISEVLEKAMALNAASRPASAEAMRMMLRNAQKELRPDGARSGAVTTSAVSIFTQETQIRPEAASSGVKQSDVATEVLPDFRSKVTHLKPRANTDDLRRRATGVRSVGNTAKERNPRRSVVLAAVLGSLILVGTAASAVFIYKPGFLGLGSRPVQSNFDKQTETEPFQPVNAGNLEAHTNAGHSAANVMPVNNGNPPKETVVRTETRPVPAKSPESLKETGKADRDAVTTPETPHPRNTAVVTEPRIPEHQPPIRNPRTGEDIPPEVWRRMTPRQRQRLREALELERRMQEQQPPPTPPRFRPTPN